MKIWLRQLDDILRGRATTVPKLAEGKLAISIGPMVVMLTILGGIYGFCMGWFSVLNRGDDRQYMQVLASMIKVPLLFLLTLIVTFPSLYVFNALVGSRLDITTLVRLLVAAIAVTLAVLASLGPVVAFFALSTETYSFMLLLNVAAFSVAGALGMMFLLQTMHRLTLVTGAQSSPGESKTEVVYYGSEQVGGEADADTNAREHAVPPPVPGASSSSDTSHGTDTGALDRYEGQVLGPHVLTVFRCWVVVFALVGGQMAWVLRPFVGKPGLEFEWFRDRDSNFIEGVLNALWSLIGD